MIGTNSLWKANTPPQKAPNKAPKKISVCGGSRMEYIDDDADDPCCEAGKPCADGATKIVAKVDIGFGNTLYIRGAGCGLDWEKGVALKNQKADFWVFETKNCTKDFEYKLLINDSVWNIGENFIARHGVNNVVSPEFQQDEQ